MGAGTAESSVHGEKWSLDTPESKACPDAVGSHPCQRRGGNLEQSSGATLRHRADLVVSSFMHFAKTP